MRVTLDPVGDLKALGQRWQSLASDADGGFFRSWVFLGCLAEERFNGARLLAVTQDGVDVALGLLGEARGRIWLNQTGSHTLDAPFIEHNGLLVRRGCAGLIAPALRGCVRQIGTLALSGIDSATLQAARQAGWLDVQQSRLAPCVRLDQLAGPYLDTLSANARAQIRRSRRLYGPALKLERAETLGQAQDWFTEMASLHQAAWARRGQPGAFGTPDNLRFHTALIARAWPGRSVDLLRVTAGDRHIGTLYAFIQDGRVLSYQSGFAPLQDKREKPGLVCHTLAIETYASAGLRCYDLLAGADRYKLTLAREGEVLHWATLNRPWSAAGLAGRFRTLLTRARVKAETGTVKASSVHAGPGLPQQSRVSADPGRSGTILHRRPPLARQAMR